MHKLTLQAPRLCSSFPFPSDLPKRHQNARKLSPPENPIAAKGDDDENSRPRSRGTGSSTPRGRRPPAATASTGRRRARRPASRRGWRGRRRWPRRRRACRRGRYFFFWFETRGKMRGRGRGGARFCESRKDPLFFPLFVFFPLSPSLSKPIFKKKSLTARRRRRPGGSSPRPRPPGRPGRSPRGPLSRRGCWEVFLFFFFCRGERGGASNGRGRGFSPCRETAKKKELF